MSTKLKSVRGLILSLRSWWSPLISTTSSRSSFAAAMSSSQLALKLGGNVCIGTFDASACSLSQPAASAWRATRVVSKNITHCSSNAIQASIWLGRICSYFPRMGVSFPKRSASSVTATFLLPSTLWIASSISVNSNAKTRPSFRRTSWARCASLSASWANCLCKIRSAAATDPTDPTAPPNRFKVASGGFQSAGYLIASPTRTPMQPTIIGQPNLPIQSVSFRTRTTPFVLNTHMKMP